MRARRKTRSLDDLPNQVAFNGLLTERPYGASCGQKLSQLFGGGEIFKTDRVDVSRWDIGMGDGSRWTDRDAMSAGNTQFLMYHAREGIPAFSVERFHWTNRHAQAVPFALTLVDGNFWQAITPGVGTIFFYASKAVSQIPRTDLI
jgi:hypothetical protein